jgi:hypothetical protein
MTSEQQTAIYLAALQLIDPDTAAREIERLLAAERFAAGAEACAALGCP